MIRRKIQLSGGLTYTVSLPKKWIRETGLRKGDEVIIQPRKDKTLLLSLDEVRLEEKPKEITLKLDKKEIDPELVERLVIAYYEAGYETIKITHRSMIAEELRDDVRRVLKKLSGLEVVEETSTKIVLHSLLDVTQINVDRTLERMEIILKSMITDLIRAIREKNPKILQNIIKRDDELDKFYSFLCKQVILSLKSRALSEKIGFKFHDLILPYKIYGKCLEDMGDIISLICRIIKLENASKYLEELTNSQDMLLNSVKAFKYDDIEPQKKVTRMYSKSLSKADKLREKDELDQVTLLQILFNNSCVEIIEICAQKLALEMKEAEQ